VNSSCKSDGKARQQDNVKMRALALVVVVCLLAPSLLTVHVVVLVSEEGEHRSSVSRLWLSLAG